MTRRRTVAAAIAIVVVAFSAIYFRRVDGGFSNVDDYLYAGQTRSYLAGLRDGVAGLLASWRNYGSNSPLVPMAALPIAMFEDNPNALVLVQLPALIALLLACRALLGQLHVPPSGQWATAAAVVCLPPVLRYSAMLHFALAASAGCVGALAAYLASDRLRRLDPTLTVGLLLGLLALTRVVAPVYIAALGAVAAVDMLSDRRDVWLRLQRCALIVGEIVLIAGPWWWMNGRAALEWVGVGYDASSGFAEEKSPVDLLGGRLTHTANETGWLLAILIAAFSGAGVFRALQQRNRPLLLSGGVILVGLVALATSSNPGTAFALPLVVIGACIAASLCKPRTWPALVVAVLLAGSVVLPTSSLYVDEYAVWLSGTPGAEQAEGALGCACHVDDIEGLNREVLEQMVAPTLVVRDDALVNINSMIFLHPELALVTLDYGARSVPSDLLAKARTVVTGSTAGPYHVHFDFEALNGELRAAGFTRAWQRQLSPANDIVVWRRTA